jgi:predicted nucleotidyltransferase
MTLTPPYPGSPAHQRLLRAIVTHYQSDPRVLAVILFGSLARGNWHPRSDLDLDIVLVDGASLDPTAELQRLCDTFTSIGEHAALIIPKRTDEGDIVLASLTQFSVRYHPLATTSPSIVASMRLLWGRIDADTIAAAGRANSRLEAFSLPVLLDRCIRDLVEVDANLERAHLWFAIESLNEARSRLFELYGYSRNAPRPLHLFQSTASDDLSASFATTLPRHDASDIRRCLLHIITLLENDLDRITANTLQLSAAHRALLLRLREAATAGLHPSQQAHRST